MGQNIFENLVFLLQNCGWAVWYYCAIKYVRLFMGLILVWFPRKSAILLSVCMSSPSALIYEPTGQLQSNIKKQKQTTKKEISKIWSFHRFPEPVTATAPWLSEPYVHKVSLCPLSDEHALGFGAQDEDTVGIGDKVCWKWGFIISMSHWNNRLHLNNMGSC